MGANSFLAYYYLLKYDPTADTEWAELTDALSVQETYFWREVQQVRALADILVPQHVAARRGPVRVWSVDGGPDEQALAALEARDFGSLNRLVPDPVDERLQLRDDLDAALAHLREVRDRYWDHDWRREHRGYGRYPENELWEAVEGFLDLVDASRANKPDT